jgi:hypothetical protein
MTFPVNSVILYHFHAGCVFNIIVFSLNSEDHRIDGRVGSIWILWRLAGGVEWIQLAQDRGRWQALVNTVKNLRVPEPELVS